VTNLRQALHSVLRLLGPAGVLGLGVLFFCVPFYFSALRPAERELAAQRASADRTRPHGPAQQVALDGQAEELRRFYALFPPVESLSDELQRLYGLARASGLDLLQGDYRAERQRAGLVSYRITLPVRGNYAQLRRFVGAVLKDMPIASIDTLRFERKKSAESQLEAQVRLTLYLRPTGEAP
jgi:Tfp pilus assembly protein PilO